MTIINVNFRCFIKVNSPSFKIFMYFGIFYVMINSIAVIYKPINWSAVEEVIEMILEYADSRSTEKE